MAFYVTDRPAQLDGWSDDAKKAMTGGPEYFEWWDGVKTTLLIAVTLAWLTERARNASRHAAVVLLFLASGPLHVSGFVVPVVVDSLDGHCVVGPGTNVSEKRVEAVQPALADGDATSAVVFPLLEARIRTSLLHGDPNRVFGKVDALIRGEPFTAQAAAARRAACDEVGPVNGDSAAAATDASDLIPVARDCREAAKLLPGEIS